MNSTQPFFSIVIATYNYGRFLSAAIESVLSQSCQDFELIVVDGGSTDNTKEILEQYSSRLAWWVSESDRGQSDAFNKGFNHSRGKYLTWLNADDILLPQTLEAVKRKLNAHPEADWATGNFFRFREDTDEVIEAQWGPHFLPHILQQIDAPLAVFGPTTFWSRQAYDKIGGLDENLHYQMDTEYWYRLITTGYKQVRVNHCCWAFRMHEASKTAEYCGHQADAELRKKKRAEGRYIYEKYHQKVKPAKHLLAIALRILDGSALVALYKKIFFVGTYCGLALQKTEK